MTNTNSTPDESTVPWQDVAQIARQLSVEEITLLRAISYRPYHPTPGQWMFEVEPMNDEVMLIEVFVRLKDSLLAVKAVKEDDDGRYWATPLGRCVALLCYPSPPFDR